MWRFANEAKSETSAPGQWKSLAGLIFAMLMGLNIEAAGAEKLQLITLDPGHFHASLVQKSMYPEVSPVVRVYAPDGPDLKEHLARVESFNIRSNNPTRWNEKVYTGPDFLERMVQDRAGNLVVIAGNNARKTEYIARSVGTGLNVLADKPMVIRPDDFDLLCNTFGQASQKHVLLYDIMTERFEITTILQRELAQMAEVFGALEKGSTEKPAVEMESVHHFFKEVAGKPLVRPAWSFDVRQQGEAIPDVGTHLVDLVHWECFPNEVLDWRKDASVQQARRWATSLTPGQFKQVTGLSEYPEFLKPDVGTGNVLNVFENGEVRFTLRGIHAKVVARWEFKAPGAGKDTHYSVLRGARADLTIRQGAEQNYQPTLYVLDKERRPGMEMERTLKTAVAKLAAKWPGLEAKRAGNEWQIVVPAKYDVGHEAHFAQVTQNFLNYLSTGRLPDWEVPNMLCKYFITTEAYRISHTGSAQ